MKKIILLLFFVASSVSNAQNIYDTYSNSNICQYPAIDPADNTNITKPIANTYEGEYQIFLDEHPWWQNPNFFNNAISYKIEAVSFPFTTN